MLIPTIHFPGNCDQAITFYKEVFGAQVKRIDYFRDAPPGTVVEGFSSPTHVMNSEVIIAGTLLSMTDGGKTRGTDDVTFLVLYDCPEEVTAVFNKLAHSGKVMEALEPQFWVSLYGVVKDRFGVSWQISAKE